MIVEKAFWAFPEMLMGNQYRMLKQEHEYEAGLMMLFSASVLQELNGRNVAHPISSMQAERRYDPSRPLRADLYVNTTRLMVANLSLAAYGWRHHNWIEGKFYRAKSPTNKHAANKSLNQAGLVVDLLRLAILPPEKPGKLSSIGRYFLHLYDREPTLHLSKKKNKTRTRQMAFKRAWVESLWKPGPQELKGFRLCDELEVIQSAVGDFLTRADLILKVTNLTLAPLYAPEGRKVYRCYLTRIDSAKVQVEGKSFEVKANREVVESAPGDYDCIRSRTIETIKRMEKDEEDPVTDSAPIESEEGEAEQ